MPTEVVVPNRGVAEVLLQARWLNLGLARRQLAASDTFFQNCPSQPFGRKYGQLSAPSLQDALFAVLHDAKRVMLDQIATELATTDSTKSRTGAALDLSLTIVSVVAMATGCSAMQDLFAAVLQRMSLLCPHISKQRTTQLCIVVAARTVTAILVAVGLLLPPVLVLLNEGDAQSSNVDGSKSRVSWVAAETGSGRGPFVVLGAVSVMLKAQYDSVAHGLVFVNLALAAVATSCILLKVVFNVKVRHAAGILGHRLTACRCHIQSCVHHAMQALRSRCSKSS